MKCSNAEVKAKVKRMAFIYWSILTLAITAGAEEFKLWHKVKDASGKISHSALLSLSVTTERDKAIKWLVGDATGEGKNFSKFVEDLHAEPFKFAEAVREAILSKSTAADFKEADVKEAIRKGLEGVTDEKLWADADGESQMSGFALLIKALVGDGKDNKGMSLEDLKSVEFLKKLFTSEIIKALGLLEKKPEGPKPTPIPAPSTLGEPSDAELKAMAETVCAAERARIEAEKRAQDKIAQLEKDLAAVNDAANKLAQAASAQDENDRNERRNNINDLLNPLLAQLQDDGRKNDNVTPPAQQTPATPTSARNDDRGSDFNPQIPPQETPPPQAVGPVAGPTEPVKAPGDIRSIVPTQRGTKELADARSASSRSTGLTQKVNNLTSDPYLAMGSIMGGMMAGPVNPIFAFTNLLRLKEVQNEVKNQLGLNNANIENIDKRLAALNKKVQKYEKEPKLGISPESVQAEQQLKDAVKKRESDVKTIEGLLAVAKTDEEKGSLQQTLLIKQIDVKNQQAELESFQSRLGFKVAEIVSDNEADRTTIEELEALKSKLEATNKELSDKDSSLNTMIAQNQFGNMGGTQQGRPNIYPVLGGSPISNGPRAGVTPQRAGLGGSFSGGSDRRRGSLATTNK